MSSIPALPTVVREGDSMTLSCGDQKMEVSANQAKHLARVINNVTPVFGDSATLASHYVDLIKRVRVTLKPHNYTDYLAATGRGGEREDDHSVTGAYVYIGGDFMLVDDIQLIGPDLLQLGTPLENRGWRVVPVSAITQITFDSE